MAINWDYVKEVGASRWLRRTFLRQFSKRVLHKDNTIVLPTGLRMRLPRTSKFATEVFTTNCSVDWGSEKIFASHLDRSGVVLDIGANIGYYSLYVLPVVSAVYSFEPDPRALASLRLNLAGHSNAHPLCLAVGNRSGTGSFVLEQSSEISHLADPSVETGKDLHKIDITTIDKFVADRELFVTGIKIDVEGGDIDVIAGSLATLKSQSPLVLTETEPNERLFGLIRRLGYRVFAFVKYSEMSEFVFREIVDEGDLRTKMLFLVPVRLHQEFSNLTAGE